ncbi:hypothetical protein [Candidatus Phytoplasma sp. AldY-WA1]|uniref:hypothetical protein n=1 Tax=Candidatus Phytoplasma sp. AldY-WA1 TaxID=2852100 RepID=UPI00254A760C|nr:hypothetical protein [Candidatus Phytoplasma sp. AldY-WA1]
MKKIFNLKEIINFLIQNSYFKIRLFNQKTNYNLDNKTLYLNYTDLYETIMMLKKIENPPFKIQIDFLIDKNYTFDISNKILYLKKEPEINPMFALNEKLYQQTFGHSQSPHKDAYSDLIERTRKNFFGNNDF